MENNRTPAGALFAGSAGNPDLVSLVGVTGFEPVTLRLSSACSNQLSYTPKKASAFLPRRSAKREGGLPCQAVEVRGFEPLTYSLQSYRSTS